MRRIRAILGHRDMDGQVGCGNRFDFCSGSYLACIYSGLFYYGQRIRGRRTAPRRGRGSMKARRRQSKRSAGLSEGIESVGGEQCFASNTGHTNGQLGEILQWPPRRMLTHSRAELAQAELRLRRIESFVTSDQYELHKEIRKMEQ